MAKITEYSAVTSLTSDNVFILDGNNGTKKIASQNLANSLLSMLTAKQLGGQGKANNLDALAATSMKSTDVIIVGNSTTNYKMPASDFLMGLIDATADVALRRSIWRGKNLGSSVTAAQWTEIKNGTFRDIMLGDYWTIGGVNYRIMDFDYFMQVGDDNATIGNVSQHHLTIMPDTILKNGVYMNATNTTAGGYVGSYMYTNTLTECKTIINAAFGSAHVLTYRCFLTNAIDANGNVSSGAWFNSTVELPSEVEVYGAPVFTQMSNGNTVPTSHTTGWTQFSGLRINHDYICVNRQSYWLRDIVSSVAFADVGGAGAAGYTGASLPWLGVRPYFNIIG